MRSVLLLWKDTRMIVLVAVCAAIYAATLIAFKTAIPLIPGITEVRVAGIFPIVLGFLFGPAGAWGLAFGNLIGDIFGGTLTPVSIAGFFGNFLLGYLPYTLWTTLIPFAEKSYVWHIRSWRSWTIYIASALVSSAACAVVISVVADLLGMAREESVLVTTESGESFVVSPADEFETEVELLRRNHSFLAMLDTWKAEKERIPLEEATKKLR